MTSVAPIASLSAAGDRIGPAVAQHFESVWRAMSGQRGVTCAPRYFRLLSGEAHPLGNCAVIPARADLADVRAAVEPLAALGLPSAVIFADTQAPGGDIAAALAAMGYPRLGAIPAMAVEIGAIKATALPDGYEFERVGSGADSDEWVRQLADGYGLPIGVAQYFAPKAFGADTKTPDAALQFFAVRYRGAIVATSMIYLADGLAGIYSVATLKEHRRKGLGEHATAEPLRQAARLGYRVGILQSSEAGHSVYRRLGFVDVGDIPIFIRMPS